MPNRISGFPGHIMAIGSYLCLLCCFGGIGGSQQVFGQDRFFDFTGFYPADSGHDYAVQPGYNPLPRLARYPTDPGWGGNFNYEANPPEPSQLVQDTYAWQNANGWMGFQPMAIPDDTNNLPYTVNWLDAQGYRLDYVVADYEGQSAEANIGAMVNTIRSSANPAINQAWIGNSGRYAAPYNMWSPYPQNTADSSVSAAFYLGSGLNLSLPGGYPSSADLVHTGDRWDNTYGGTKWWGYYSGFENDLTPNQYAAYTAQASYTSPNQRSALFYSPLEAVSSALRHLPEGHEVLPYVTDYLPYGTYYLDPGQAPTVADNAASIQHYRLRGAVGFTIFYLSQSHIYSDGSPVIRMGHDAYCDLAAASWKQMDGFFAHPGAERTLNLDTTKTIGLEWSAMVKGNRVMALVSNLSATAQSVDWSDRPHLPQQSPTVAANTHVLLQYRTSYFDNQDMEQYQIGNTLNNQQGDPWSGSNPDQFVVASPPGSGNDSDQAVVSAGVYAWKVAWRTTENPGYTASDKVVYSSWLYRGGSWAGFEPVNTDGANPQGEPDAGHGGPSVALFNSILRVRQLRASGTTYQAVNFIPVAGKWYDVQLAVDPTVGDGLGSVYVRNVTDGQKDFIRVVFDDATTPGTVERLLQVPLLLGTNRNTTNFDGWQISAYGAGNGIDNLNTGYYVPRMNDNFEHYQAGVTNNNQTPNEIKWYGPAIHGPSEWTVAAPYGSGNSSSLAATPSASAYTAKAWWKTERPDFAITEPTVYSAQLYGTSGIGFEAVNTTGSGSTALTTNNQIGFYTTIYWGALRFRASRDAGDAYQATNFTAQSGKWYDIQIQIDQTRDIDGTAGGYYGVARVWVKNLTDNTDPILIAFDNLTTGGSTESFTELPMRFTTNLNNPTLWDGWEVYGYDHNVQIDALRSFLYPYSDFLTYNQYIDDADPTFSVQLVPEPASIAWLILTGLLIVPRSSIRKRNS